MDLSSWRVLLPLVAFAMTSSALKIYGHETEREHVHCGDNGEKCEVDEDVVRGYRYVTPNSGGTPSTGGNLPTNSASKGCVGRGCIDYASSYTAPAPIEERRKYCDAEVEKIQQQARDAGIENPRLPTRIYHSCMKGVIMQKFLKEAWCSLAGDYAKDVAASGGCAIYCEKKRGKRKAFCVAACVSGVLLATGCD